MKDLFIISDIHGMFAEFIALLKRWEPTKQTLVILGDMIDRGHDSYKVVKHIMELAETYDVLVLKGNHDQLLLDFVKDPYEFGFQYQSCGGEHTMRSFAEDDRIILYSFEERAERIKKQCQPALDFLDAALSYKIVGQVLLTHAGFNPHVTDWRDSSEEDFMWVRNHYLYPNGTGFVNVFGHTPTALIATDELNDVWVSEDGKYIGIDGSCAYGGQLNALVLNMRGEILETHVVRTGQTISK